MWALISANHSVRGSAASLLLCALTLWATPRASGQVLFADYMPITLAQYGVRTFEWTYGGSGGFSSQVAGTKVIHYGDGTRLTGTEITNVVLPEMLSATAYNDGSVVKILGISGYYLSTDSMLTSHPSAWSFGIVADGMVVDQRPYYWVKEDRLQWSFENSQMVLFDIQDVTVPAGRHPGSIIMWTLDTKYPFASLDLASKRPELGIRPPSSQDTRGFSITGFDIYGFETGAIAWGDIDAGSGELRLAAELKKVVPPAQFGPADLAGTWSVQGLNVGDASAWQGWSRFELSVDEQGRCHMVPGTYLNSSGETDAASTGTMTITDGGAVSIRFDADSDNRRAQGAMAGNRGLIVITMDDEGGSGLSILQKHSGTTFATRDMAGTWSESIIQTGIWQGWMHGDVTIDPAGVMLDVPGSSLDSSGDLPGLGGATLTVTSEGVVGVKGYPLNHGTLSDSKDVSVFTYTMEDAAYGLCVNQKRSDRPFVRGDLAGLWRISGLSTRGGRWADWVRGTWMVNADGSSNGVLDKSDGTTTALAGTVTMASYGVFRIDPFTYSHGVIGAARDLIVLVTTDLWNEHQMLIGTRADMTGSGAGG